MARMRVLNNDDTAMDSSESQKRAAEETEEERERKKSKSPSSSKQQPSPKEQPQPPKKNEEDEEKAERPKWMGMGKIPAAGGDVSNASSKKGKDGGDTKKKSKKAGGTPASAAAPAEEEAEQERSKKKEGKEEWKGKEDKGSLTKAETEALIKTLASMVAGQAEDIRDLSSAVFSTWLIKEDSWIVDICQEGGRIYHQQTLKIKEEEGLTGKELGDKCGPPHIFIWSSLLCQLWKHHDKGAFPLMKERDLQLLRTKSWKEVEGAPRYLRCRKASDGRFVMMIVFAPEWNRLEMEVKEWMKAEGGDYRQGTAPRKPLERELQRLLEKFRGGKGKGKGKGGGGASSSSSSSSGKK